MQKPKVKAQEKLNYTGMLGVNSCMQVLVLFVNVFLIAQIFVITGYDITSVALFLLLDVITLAIFYFIASFICKKIPAIWITRIATILLCLFILLTILWEDGLYSHFMLFGFLWGAVQGLHWGAMNFITAKVFKKDRIHTYFILAMSLTAFVGIVFPFSFGLAIDYGSLLLTSGFVLAIGILQLVFSFLIKPKTLSQVKQERKLHFKQYYRALKKANHRKPAFLLWLSVMLAGFPYTLIALMTILIVKVHGTNTSIGIYGSIFAAVGIISLVIYKLVNPRIKTSIYFFTAIFPLAVSIALFFYVGPISIIIFNAAIIFRKLIQVEEQNLRINATRYWGGEQYLIESHMFYEFAFMVGRVLSCGLLLIVGLTGTHLATLATAIALTLAALLAHAIIQFFWKRKYAI